MSSKPFWESWNGIAGDAQGAGGHKMIKKTVTQQVEDLYEDIGWTMVDGVTYDAKTAEDLRPTSADYVSACRLRVLRHLPKNGHRLLDMGSGPLQYPEYLRYSEGFETRVCVDLSQRALDIAKAKLGNRGEYHRGDFLELRIEGVDAAVSLHTIYHIEQSRQEAAVRKLVALTKPGGTIVIVYSNPNNLVSLLLAPARRLAAMLRPERPQGDTPDTIYFRPHPLGWWKRFENAGSVTVYPWRTFSTPAQRALVPGNELGRRLLSALFVLEDRFPRFFRTVGCYPMIVIRRAL
jgi:SAM-dependent methyltransferase